MIIITTLPVACTQLVSAVEEKPGNAEAVFLLRTADCSGNQLLELFDSTLRAGLSEVLNVDLNDD